MSNNVKTFGQVFTSERIVQQMFALRQNNGSILEPSCGVGAFSNHFPKSQKSVAIEIDKSKAPGYAFNIDYFEYSTSNKFDTIIGNPPYVKFQDIEDTTKKLLDTVFFDKRTNLYMFFIKKCIDHLNPGGELIFITPKDFLKSTSCIKLNNFIFEQGTITDIIDFGDEIVFPNFSPNCIIFRFEKGNYTRKTNNKLSFQNMNGQLIFTKSNNTVKFSDIFYVKVGAVSGADEIFFKKKGNKLFVTSETATTGKMKKAIYPTDHSFTVVYDLNKHKEELIKRGIRDFNQDNWWEWGRKLYKSSSPRIYVNCKTRQDNPFFTHKCKNYTGAVLGIFFKDETNNTRIQDAINDLNKVNWKDIGFKIGGRFIFSQKSLENCLLPNSFKKYILPH